MMRRLALLDATGLVLNVASWDGASAYDPVRGGVCASTEDATDRPDVGAGWTYSGGQWSAPAPASPDPDPNGFVTAVVSDSSLAVATRTAALKSLYAMAVNLDTDGGALIGPSWQLLVEQYAISQADQDKVHDHAVIHGIRGI